MKRILILLLALCSLKTMAQYPVSSISITLPPQPKPNIGDWAMPFVITAQARLVLGQVPGNLVESRILVTIKRNGSKFCGNYTQQTAPYSQFNSPTKTWSAGMAINLVSTNCEMPPGNYELCVQFFSSNAPSIPLSNEVCKAFIIPERNSTPANYTPPQNIMPFDGKVYTQQEANIPIMFRWTPVLPKPKEDVIYKIKVVEIMPGQSKAQAMLNNTPLEEKELRNETQTSFKLAPRCHNCGMGFLVEAVSAERVQGREPRNYGKSEATGFSFEKGDNKDKVYSPPQNITPVDGKVFTKQEANQPIMFRWTPVLPKPKEDVIYKVRLYEVAKGTSKAQAIKSGSPVETIEVKNITQTSFKLAPRCNNCEWVWNVEAIAVERVQGGEPKNYGKSEATQFVFGNNNSNARLNAVQCNLEMQPVELATCTNRKDAKGNNIYKVCFLLEDKNPDNLIYFNHSINSANLGNLITIDNAVSGHNYNITPVSPSSPLPDILKPGTNYPICFEIAIPASQSFPIQYTLHSTTHDSLTTNTVIARPCDKTNSIKAVESCRCEFCDALTKEHFSQAEFNYSDDNNSLQLNQMLNLPTQFKIKQLKAEIITFDWQTDNPECRKCQKDDNQFGVIIDGTLNRGNTILDGTYPDGIPNSHELDFNCLPADGVVLNNGASVNLNISLPLQTTLSCCKDKFTFCIRYTIVTTDCKTCTIVKCYTQVPPRQHKMIINNGGGSGN